MSISYAPITELAGDKVSREQIERLHNRYYWAGQYCTGRDVLEVACGSAPGVGYLMTMARSVHAGDYSQEILDTARRIYGARAQFSRFDAQALPFLDSSFDVVILFEAIYYVPSAGCFVAECRRVLRPDGWVLIATANKDLYDFNPSPHSHRYFGVVELADLFVSAGFSVSCYGGTPIHAVSAWQRALRPAKLFASKFGLIPKTSHGKAFLKRLVFGPLQTMPEEVKEGVVPFEPPTQIPVDKPDTQHKVIYCAARLR